MVAEALDRELVHASEREVPEVQEVEALLRRLQQAGSCPKARLIGAENEEMELPGPLYQVLTQAATLLLEGASIAIVPYHKELTTQEAADFLNMSRQFFVRLLDQGAIPYEKVGTHRRVRFSDVLDYREARRKERRGALARMTALAEEAGEYD